MKRYLFPLALVLALVAAAHASAGGLQAADTSHPAPGSWEAVCGDPCCAPVLTMLQNARARLACLVTPPCCPKVSCCVEPACDPCCPPPVLARIRAALCCPPPILVRLKAALCCPGCGKPVCCCSEPPAQQ
jgi:hypothetical protein